VSLIQRWLSRSRVRDAKKRLAEETSAKCYLALAHEHARLGQMADVKSVCEEALAVFPAHPELQRMCDRAQAILLEDRTRRLTSELRDAPRPALYRELAELFLGGGRLDRAEETAEAWFASTQDPAALLLRFQARLQRFTADKRRDDARACFEWLDQAEKLLARDERPLRLRLELLCSIGAWRDARKIVGQLLELAPGDPALEARFRTYNSLAEKAPTVDAALREIERTGALASERAAAPVPQNSNARAIRPTLQALAAEASVEAALYERGATALVQGTKGATAERCARSVREIVHKSRTLVRRLGLGAPVEIELETTLTSLFVVPTDAGCAAIACEQPTIPARLRASVLELAGSGADASTEEPA
jgi:tetratricopeptide (TPR) repeat protein